MSWWGKIAGGALGMLSGGPLGAALGATLGHQLDKLSPSSEARRASQQEAQMAYFAASFSLMGAMSKADGKVTPDEIQVAEALMSRMQLDASMRATAIKLFAQGKTFGPADIDATVAQFRQIAGRRGSLCYGLIQTLIQSAYADGVLDPAEQQLLSRVASGLGIPAPMIEQMLAMLRWQQSGAYSQQAPSQSALDEAYAVLGVSADCDHDTARRAYRKLISRNHPDRLIASGVPEEMVAAATQKTQQITEAWERIVRARGW